MKPKSKKIDPEASAPAKPSRIQPKNFPHELEQYEDKLIKLGLEFETLEKEAYPKVKKIIDGALPQLQNEISAHARRHYDRIEGTALENIHAFLDAAPIWETKFIPGLQSHRHEVEALYRAGWKYQCSAYDEKAKIGGVMYHRPKLPDTFEAFKKIYQSIMVDKQKTEATIKQREAYYAEQAKKAKTSAEAAEAGEAEVIEDEVKPKTVKKVLVKMRPKAKS